MQRGLKGIWGWGRNAAKGASQSQMSASHREGDSGRDVAPAAPHFPPPPARPVPAVPKQRQQHEGTSGKGGPEPAALHKHFRHSGLTRTVASSGFKGEGAQPGRRERRPHCGCWTWYMSKLHTHTHTHNQLCRSPHLFRVVQPPGKQRGHETPFRELGISGVKVHT